MTGKQRLRQDLRQVKDGMIRQWLEALLLRGDQHDPRPATSAPRCRRRRTKSAKGKDRT